MEIFISGDLYWNHIETILLFESVVKKKLLSFLLLHSRDHFKKKIHLIFTVCTFHFDYSLIVEMKSAATSSAAAVDICHMEITLSPEQIFFSFSAAVCPFIPVHLDL